jgi:hypothetical protein
MLARIDGKSPVEYLTEDSRKDAVRAFARSLIADPHYRSPSWRSAGSTRVDVRIH